MEPRELILEPHNLLLEPRGVILDAHDLIFEHRGIILEPQDLILDPPEPILEAQGGPGRSLGRSWDAPGSPFWSHGDLPGPPQRAIFEFDQILIHFGYENAGKMV